MTFEQRCINAFLGLAIGDAYGRPLEFLTGPAARDRAVDTSPGVFRWTDDTHMSLYLAEAVLAMPPDHHDTEVFGAAVGERFVAWSEDPLTPSTAPGNTCMEGVRRWRRDPRWQVSGVPHSDGCGAVMRIAPLAMGMAGDELELAAEVQASLTHGHVNATEAAIAATWILRRVLETGRLHIGLIGEARLRLAAGARGGSVAESLEGALDLASRDERWLDEAAVTPGDGGWRSGSALGLALAAALRWGDRPALAIEKAARIDGDSDSVAALCGMFLGATGARLPEAWVSALPERERIEQLARALAARGRPVLAVADLHGHPDALRALVAWSEDEAPVAWICPLGDFCDNGPDVPGLLDLMVELREQLGDRFRPILGNHDLACLRALDDDRWFARWAGGYWNRGAGTPQAYGAATAAAFRSAFPASHRALLQALPWHLDTGRYLLVHAGMLPGPLEPQLAELRERRLPRDPMHVPQPLRDKGRATLVDPDWERVVVSGHTKLPLHHFVGANRITLNSNACTTGVVRAVLLPERRWLEVERGVVREVLG